MATKAKNVKMTKANQKMLTYIKALEVKKDEALRRAFVLKNEGKIEFLHEDQNYDTISTQWSHAIDMFIDVNGITTEDYFSGNSWEFTYNVK